MNLRRFILGSKRLLKALRDEGASSFSNSYICGTTDRLDKAYSYLKSSARDKDMGALSAENPRFLYLTPGRHQISSTLHLDTDYVYLKALCGGPCVVENTGSGRALNVTTAFTSFNGILFLDSEDKADSILHVSSPGELEPRTLLRPKERTPFGMKVLWRMPCDNADEISSVSNCTKATSTARARESNAETPSSIKITGDSSGSYFNFTSTTFSPKVDIKGKFILVRFYLEEGTPATESSCYMLATISMTLYSKYSSPREYVTGTIYTVSGGLERFYPGWHEIVIGPGDWETRTSDFDPTSIENLKLQFNVGYYDTPNAGQTIYLDSIQVLEPLETGILCWVLDDAFEYDETIQGNITDTNIEILDYAASRNVPISVMVTPSFVGTSSGTAPNRRLYMDWDELRNAQNQGHLICNHTHEHLDCKWRDSDGLDNFLAGIENAANALISRGFVEGARLLALPYGKFETDNDFTVDYTTWDDAACDNNTLWFRNQDLVSVFKKYNYIYYPSGADEGWYEISSVSLADCGDGEGDADDTKIEMADALPTLTWRNINITSVRRKDTELALPLHDDEMMERIYKAVDLIRIGGYRTSTAIYNPKLVRSSCAPDHVIVRNGTPSFYTVANLVVQDRGVGLVYGHYPSATGTYGYTKQELYDFIDYIADLRDQGKLTLCTLKDLRDMKFVESEPFKAKAPEYEPADDLLVYEGDLVTVDGNVVAV